MKGREGPVRTPPPPRTDRIAGGALLLFSLWVAWESRSFVVGFPADPVGPRALPLFSAGILAMGGLVLFARPEADPRWPETHTFVRLLGAVGLLLLFPVVLPALGFIATTTGVMAGLSLLFGGPLLRSAGGALLFSGALYLLFVYALGIPLPIGRLFLAGPG